MAKINLKNNSKLTRYLSFGIQLMAAVGIGLYVGHWADTKFMNSFPLMVWILPTLLLVFMLINLVRTFSKKQKEEE